MKVIESSAPEFYTAAAIIKQYLPRVEITPRHQIICDEGRYYGLLYVVDNVATYDHVVVDKMCCNPEFIFIVLTYIFSVADICNVFIKKTNGPSIYFASGLGFINTGELRQTPETLMIYSMTRAEWMNNRIRRHFIKRHEHDITRNDHRSIGPSTGFSHQYP